MMRALYTGASGVKSHQVRMDAIGNNISNVNTVGFKSSRVTFSDMLSQNLSGATGGRGNVGGTNPKQIGLGAYVGSTDLMFRDGAPLSTGKNTDLALSGDALFVVQKNGQTYYTRDGAFEFDAAGNYVLPGSGHFVQGWTATDGVINTTGAVGDIKVTKGQEMPAKATDNVDYLYNLDADIPLVTGINGGSASESGEVVATEENPITLTLSDQTTRIVEEGSYKIGSSLPIVTTAKIYDSYGNTHQIPIYFSREGEIADGVVNSANKWIVSLSPSTGLKKGDTTTTELTDANGNTITASLNAAEIQFDSAGKLVSSSTSETAPDISGLLTLTFPAESAPTPTEGAVPAAPAAPAVQNVNLDFSELTQFAGSTTVNSQGNGNTAGVLKEIQIDNSGIITGIYTNDVRQAEAQVAVAHFVNSPGLLKNGTSLYIESLNSGAPSIGSADAFGATITAGATEMSNVDVANEFADMIITQRGFQSNTKVVTVTDEMIETAVNMKR